MIWKNPLILWKTRESHYWESGTWNESWKMSKSFFQDMLGGFIYDTVSSIVMYKELFLPKGLCTGMKNTLNIR